MYTRKDNKAQIMGAMVYECRLVVFAQ